MARNKFVSLGRKPVPRFPGWWTALGPGIVWMAIAQGSGELIWWIKSRGESKKD